VLAHYANTGKETLSPFIDSSIDHVLLQTNPGSTNRFLVRPETTVFGKAYVLLEFIFFLSVIFELRRPIGAKFCTMLGAAFNYIIPVQNVGGASLKISRGQKHAKFGPILVDIKVRRRISPEGMKIFKIGELGLLVRQRFLPR